MHPQLKKQTILQERLLQNWPKRKRYRWDSTTGFFFPPASVIENVGNFPHSALKHSDFLKIKSLSNDSDFISGCLHLPVGRIMKSRCKAAVWIRSCFPAPSPWCRHGYSAGHSWRGHIPVILPWEAVDANPLAAENAFKQARSLWCIHEPGRMLYATIIQERRTIKPVLFI